LQQIYVSIKLGLDEETVQFQTSSKMRSMPD